MIGDNIRFLREDSNLSPKGLSALLNTSRQTVYNWENGDCKPSMENIEAMCKIFNVSVEQLLGDNDNGENDITEY